MRRPRRLKAEERAFWEEATRAMAPHAENARAPESPAGEPESPSGNEREQEAPSRRIAAGQIATDLAAARTHKPCSGTGGKDARFPHSGVDGKVREKLRKGRLAPEATLDLHGMSRDKAHDAVTRFVGEKRRAGVRRLLIITGKGGDRQRAVAESPGLLRRDVPVWLSHEPLASMIATVESASRTHGGEGALYVYLRRL